MQSLLDTIAASSQNKVKQQIRTPAQLAKLSFTSLRAQGKRSLTLDAIRGVAIILVLFHHMFAMPASQTPGLIGVVMHTLKENGWIGVDLFFVLSGFLVSGLLFEEFTRTGGMNLRRFLLRRGFKIYPSYYCFLACGFAFATMMHCSNIPQILPSMLCFFSNYTMGSFDVGSNAILMHGWSLSVEEQFYFLLAGMLFALSRNKKLLKLLPFVCIATCVVTLLLREYTFQNFPNWASARFATHLKIDALMFGVLLSYFYRFHRTDVENLFRFREKFFLPLAAIFLAPCALTGYQGHFNYVCGFTSLYLGCGIALMTCIINPFRPSMSMTLLSRIGFFSYSIYLWHRTPQILLEAVMVGHDELFWVKQLIYFTTSIVGGILMAKLIEWPTLALRDRLIPSSAGPGSCLNPTASQTKLSGNSTAVRATALMAL